MSELRKYPVLMAIGQCESGLRQFDENGKVLQGRVVPQDEGILQINIHYHFEEAKALGYDITTLEGNIGYGIYLYKHEGTKPWIASKPCWSKLVTDG